MQRGRISLLLGGAAVALTVLLVVVDVMGDGPLRSHSVGATGGNSITSPDTGGYVGYYNSLALDSAGNPLVSYWDGTNRDLKVLHCGNPNCTAGNSITSPDTGGYVGEYTSLVLDALGNPVVAYRDETNSDLKVLHCNDANCAGAGESITSPDTLGDVGYTPSLALDATGNPVVSYSYYTGGINGDLRVLHCNDANCAGGGENISSPDTLGDVLPYTSLTLDISGNPVVSYFDSPNSDLKVLHCNDANCAGGDESITSPDDTAGVVGYFTSLKLDVAGNPVVSYRDETNADLKVLHCNDANCAGGGESITSPDTGGSVGFDTSLELDVAGNPVVSYRDVNNGDLRVLHCNDANCAGGGESIVSPDTADDVGYWNTSLELDTAGDPVVSYHDQTNGDLKLLHCSDPNCAGAKAPTPTLTPTPTDTPTPTQTPTPTTLPGDTDLDGCTDVREQQTLSGSETSGGWRDPLNFWDFADVWTHPYGNPTKWERNRAVGISDIFAVAKRFATSGDPNADPLAQPANDVGYHTDYDRTFLGPNAWNLGPPSGAIGLDDVFNVSKQAYHSCAF